jgi:hypothetical protein
MEDVGIFYGHLVYFVVMWYILLSLGKFCGYLVYFFSFWYFLPRKIWQPLWRRSAALSLSLAFFAYLSQCIYIFSLTTRISKKHDSFFLCFFQELPDFSWLNIPKWGKYTKLQLNYQLAIKYTKWSQNIPNDHKIYQHFPF